MTIWTQCHYIVRNIKINVIVKIILFLSVHRNNVVTFNIIM